MADFLLSTYSNPAHSLTDSAPLSLTFGSDVDSTGVACYLDGGFPSAIAMGTALSLDAGSSVGGLPVAVIDSSTTGVTGSVSIAPSSGSGGGGGPAVPSTGQIYPLGYQ